MKSKKHLFGSIIALFVLTFFFTSCSEDDSPENTSYDTLLEELTAGNSWHIDLTEIENPAWSNHIESYWEFYDDSSEFYSRKWSLKNTYTDGCYAVFGIYRESDNDYIVKNTKTELVLYDGEGNYHFTKNGNTLTFYYQEGKYEPTNPVPVTHSEVKPLTDVKNCNMDA